MMMSRYTHVRLFVLKVTPSVLLRDLRILWKRVATRRYSISREGEEAGKVEER